LTLSFANTLAYERFLEGRDLPARYLDRDLNRLWRDDWIDEDTSSREAARARELRPVLASVDTLLDLHSTATVSQPFLVLADLDKSRAIADAVAIPPCQQLMPGGCLDGRHMIDYGHFADPDDPAVAVTLECGQHDDPAAADVAQGVALRLLEVLDVVPAQAMQFDSKACAIRRLRTIEPYTVQSDRFEMCIRRGGFVSVRSGETVASDGGEDVVAPYDSIIVAPRPNPPAGATGFIWAVEVT
jgi:succinylglutamate desuccinylase